MIKQQKHKTASGSALVIALLILLAMTIVGVATLASVNMQERMAGNANLQALALESASAGLSEALAWAFESPNPHKAWGDCERGKEWRQDFWETPTDLVLSDSFDLQYRLRNDCLEAPEVLDESSDFVPPIQFFVTSEGTVLTVDGAPLSRRQIEVRIDNFRGDGLSAIRVEGKAEVNFGGAPSNRFVVDGGGGPAISTSSEENASLITGEIGEKRIENYGGGVVQSQYPPPFNTADGLARLALLIKGYMQYVDVPASTDPNVDVTAHCDGTPPLDREGTEHGTMRFVDGPLDIGNGEVHGITYVSGNFKAQGNASGSGLLIVEGTIQTGGTPDFDGLIIGLGGSIDMTGGGTGETNGMLFATNLPLMDVNLAYDERIDPLNGWSNGWLNPAPDPDDLYNVPGLFHLIGDVEYETGPFDGEGVVPYKELLKIGDDDNDPFGPDGFGPTTLDFAKGGGNHSFNYDCGKVESIRDFLATCTAEDGQPALLVDDWQSFGCEVPGRGAAIAAIRSWRENLGWRELLR